MSNVLRDQIGDIAHTMRSVVGQSEQLIHDMLNQFDDVEFDVNKRIVINRACSIMCKLYDVSDREKPKFRGGPITEFRNEFYEWLDNECGAKGESHA